MEIQDLPLWEKMNTHKALFSFDLEITARCYQNCRHCYINLPAADRKAMARELSLAEIEHIADQAVELGAMWCLITGGDPLLRPDFRDIYMALKRRGLLVSVFTTATLITEEHITLFKKYPPRDIEVTVYGATRKTYEQVTRQPGSFHRFIRGLDLLQNNGIKLRLKAMALKSNMHELKEIADFCRRRTKDYFRYDPQLHLRLDGNQQRNKDIRSERLSPKEIAALECADEERFTALERECRRQIKHRPLSYYDDCMVCAKRKNCEEFNSSTLLFRCGAGKGSFNVGYDGTFRLCSSLCAPGTTCNLRHTSLREALDKLVPQVRSIHVQNLELLKTCGSCTHINICLWCPAHAHLETGDFEGITPYFCRVAHCRAKAIEVMGDG